MANQFRNCPSCGAKAGLPVLLSVGAAHVCRSCRTRLVVSDAVPATAYILMAMLTTGTYFGVLSLARRFGEDVPWHVALAVGVIVFPLTMHAVLALCVQYRVARSTDPRESRPRETAFLLIIAVAALVLTAWLMSRTIAASLDVVAAWGGVALACGLVALAAQVLVEQQSRGRLRVPD